MRVNDTSHYHRHELHTLGWELTVCNALSLPESPCRRLLEKERSYGALLYTFLEKHLPMGRLRNILEIGGGYGYLMRAFLELRPDLRVTMMDISPYLLARQRETLRDHHVVFIEDDFLCSVDEVLCDVDLVLFNENLGDFPTVIDLPREIASPLADPREEYLRRRVFHFVRKYAIDLPEGEDAAFNLGAAEAVEKVCRASVPFVFLTEHSCEAQTPTGFEPMVKTRSLGRPERIALKGHDEYTVNFSHLQQIAASWGYRSLRGPLADIVPLRWDKRLRVIMAAPVPPSGDAEIFRHFVEDLFKYEYLLLMRRDGTRTDRNNRGGNKDFPGATRGDNTSPICLRCGKCCLAGIHALAKEEDIKRWRAEGRGDILTVLEYGQAVWAGDRLVSSADGHHFHGCPFLARGNGCAVCTIYETRPLTCRVFQPGSSELCSLVGQISSQEVTMLVHVVLMKFKEGTKDEAVENLKKALGALPTQIPEIKKYEFGPDILHTERSYDFALVAEYDDIESLKRYQVHPAHVPVLGMVREMSESVVVVDFVK